MAYAYILLAEAQLEYEDAVTWYLERSVRAAKGFVLAVEESLDRICKHPERWHSEYKYYRELGLKNYPFTIIYSLDESVGRVVILSVFHHSRNPEEKYNKRKK